MSTCFTFLLKDKLEMSSINKAFVNHHPSLGINHPSHTTISLIIHQYVLFFKALLHCYTPPPNLRCPSPNILRSQPSIPFLFKPSKLHPQHPFLLKPETLITFLIYKTPPTGFALASLGQYHSQQVYGLSLCRGDVSPSDCKTCVTEATSEILKRCSYNKGAIIWYDNCLFKYLDQDFFGRIDNTNQFSMFNLQNVSEPAAFNYKAKELLSGLAKQAHVSPKMYATGEVKLGQWNITLYGLTQCTNDLSANDCKKCLEDAISELPNCCDGKQGGRVVGGSCNLRYEIYPFLED